MRRYRLPALWREALLALLWLLPLLIPYGAGLWFLYREKLFLPWLAAMLVLTAALSLLGYWLGRRKGTFAPPPEDDPDSSLAERRARAAIRDVMAGAGDRDLASPAAVEDLLRRTLRAVAEAWHPGHRHAELRFTLPEALALAEQLSRRLREVILTDLPALRHLEVAHAFRLREQVRPAKTIWKVYRIGRFAFNPVSALLTELRGSFMEGLTPMVLASARGKIAAVLVRETGDLAIRLYSGQLRADEVEERREAEPEPGPLRLFLAGQPNAGKSSVLNALSGRARAVASPLPCPPGFQAYALEEETAGELMLLDSGGLRAAPDRAWIQEAARADLILWIAAAHRADRAADQTALAAFRKHFADRPQARMPPVLLVLTHADRLDPAMEWSPPYDPEEGEGRKERNMRASLQAACGLLSVDPANAVPVMAADPESAWNVEALWWHVHQALPAARQSQLERLARQRSLLQGVRDGVRTLPGVLRQGWRLLDRS